MKRALIITLAGLAITTSATVFAAGDAAKGKTLTATCVACHGADGNSVNPDWPKLAGQKEEYIIKQLTDFRSGARVDATMTPMAMGIASDEDVLHLAAYFSSQSITSGTANKDKVALGEAIYKGGIMAKGVAACSACHGNAAIGAPVVGDKEAWAEVTSKGFDSVLHNAINGINGMPPRGGTDFSDEKMKEIVDFMINSSK